MSTAPELQFSLLTDPLIRYRSVADGRTVHASLPQLLAALAADGVRDYPALRPHQRHPWHAFLVQLAALALHQAGESTPFTSPAQWQAALLALSPDDADGAAWCLVTPPGRPALLQAPNVNWNKADWDTVHNTPDQLDMLMTSKNHDLKGARMHSAEAEDWIYALISLQTLAGSNSGSHKGISRMNSGAGSRAGVGVVPRGNIGQRWLRDISVCLRVRDGIVEKFVLKQANGIALVWLQPWDGVSKISFSVLDPLYIEICRRVRLFEQSGRIFALRAATRSSRIDADTKKGATGDPWMPIDISEGGAKAFTVQGRGFDYRSVVDLLFSGDYIKSAMQVVQTNDGEGLTLLAQSIGAGGQSKTAGYHERRIPIRPKLRSLLSNKQDTTLALIAGRRVAEISGTRWLIEQSLAVLFNKGIPVQKYPPAVTQNAKTFAAPFEQAEDSRFFDDLNAELEAADPAAQRLQWMQDLVGRAEAVLQTAFLAGPRNGIQKYKAQSQALSRFHSGLRGDKSPLPELAHHYRQQAAQRAAAPTEEPPLDYA